MKRLRQFWCWLIHGHRWNNRLTYIGKTRSYPSGQCTLCGLSYILVDVDCKTGKPLYPVER